MVVMLGEDVIETDVTVAGGAPVMDATDGKVKVASPEGVVTVARLIGAV